MPHGVSCGRHVVDYPQSKYHEAKLSGSDHSEPSWIDEIVIYLKENKLPENREHAQRIRYHAEHDTIMVNEPSANPSSRFKLFSFRVFICLLESFYCNFVIFKFCYDL